MAFDWREYLALAQYLGKGHAGVHQDAALRCAVSRAYYGAFCYARNHARDRASYRPSYRADDHARLIDHYRQVGSPVESLLGRLRTWRNQCDYDDSVARLEMMYKFAMASAEKVFEELR